MTASCLRSGLVSITFRTLPWEEVLKEAAKAGLDGIEWGGDAHVPHGDAATAERVGEATRAAGLALPTYGSYFRAGVDSPENPALRGVVRAAAALGAGAIRVWAGKGGSKDADAVPRHAVAASLRETCDRAADAGVPGGVTLEYHAGTLTDTAASTLDLLDAVDRENLSTLWQTTNGASDDHSLENLRRLREHVLHAHVFDWDTGPDTQRPLAEGADRWGRFLPELAAPGRERFCLLEFVRGGTVEQLRDDAATLRAWLVGTR